MGWWGEKEIEKERKEVGVLMPVSTMRLSSSSSLLGIALLLSFAICTRGGLFSRWVQHSIRQSLFEQDIEDGNAVHKFDNHLARRLIVMPLTDAFRPHAIDPMFGKIHFGDKVSLPSSLGKLIFSQRLEVPWLFELKPVRQPSDYAPERIAMDVKEEKNHEIVQRFFSRGRLAKAYASPLDFRAPENYIFLPQWLMNDLDLQPFDLVDASFVRIRLAELVVIQPLSANWDDLIAKKGDPKALLEHEVNKYSSLTAGSTIYIEVDGEVYPLHIKATRAEGGVNVQGVRVQDSDVRVDIDRSVVDQLLVERERDKRRAK